MIKKHKNEFIDVIESYGLKPVAFNTTEESNGDFTLKYMNTPFTFKVIISHDSYLFYLYEYTSFAPGFPIWFMTEQFEISILYLIKSFKEWIEHHLMPYLDDLSEPDLWQIIEQKQSFIQSSDSSEDEFSPFTELENDQLKLAINEFRFLIAKEFEPTHEQLALINKRLDYLQTTLDKKLNRFDWKSIAFGIINVIRIFLSLSKEKTEYLFNLFNDLILNIPKILPTPNP